MVPVTIFTDPGCPFAFCGQKVELQLLWHFGNAVEIRHRMIGLRPESVGLLRALRTRSLSGGEMIDEPEVLVRAAGDADISVDSLRGWLSDSAVRVARESDMQLSREPLPEARAVAHRLAGDPATSRSSTGSAVLEHDGRRFVAVGLQPFAVFECAMANLAPEVGARPFASGVDAILDWAPYSLASAEIAQLRGVDPATAISELRSAGAAFARSANDGYWSAGSAHDV